LPETLNYQVFKRDVMGKTGIIHSRDDSPKMPKISKKTPKEDSAQQVTNSMT
jgi:hypothetical protein